MMKVLFFAQLREQLGTAEVQVNADAATSIEALKTYLCDQNAEWRSYLTNKKILVAVNHQYIKADIELKSGDEVAFFPPVTGG